MSADFPLYPQTVVIPVFSLISMLLSIAPLILHWKNRSLPATSLICWYLTLNLFNVINALIWPTDDTATWWNGSGLCDIEVKIMTGSYVGVPGTLACLFRSLACVLDTKRANLIPTKQQRWRNRAMDLLFCVVVPLIAMCTQYIYQSNRYFIYAISGCVNTYDESWVSIVLAFIWPPIICLIAAYYCGLVLYRLHKYRSQFGDILNSSNSKLNKSRFMRLFLLSLVMLMGILPIQAFVVYKNVMGTLPLWHAFSWSRARQNWDIIFRVPSNGQAFFDRWVPVFSGLLFFIFFGCGRDATRIYFLIFRFLGLGQCFSGVQLLSESQQSASTSRSTTGSRGKFLFHKKWISGRSSDANDSIPLNPSSQDSSPPRNNAHHARKASGLKSLFSFRSRPSARERFPPAPSLSIPSNTISTTAWAGMSQTQSRASSELSPSAGKQDFIRVKQVISQESEMHV